MLCFSKTAASNEGINCNTHYTNIIVLIDYMEYNIPYWSWLILVLYILMAAVNSCFKKDREIKRHSFENPDKETIYESTAAYYEAKCDFVLRKKFPWTAKILNRIVYICTEMMILIILIIQGFILAFQPPSFLFWGFLIFSLTL